MDTSTVISKPAVILDLPLPWLARLFQHVTSGPGGLARAAVLSQACKFLHKLSDSSAITYGDIQHSRSITSSGDPMFRWIAKRRGRINGLTLTIEIRELYAVARYQALEEGLEFEELGVEDPLQQLHIIPNVCVKLDGWLGMLDHFLLKRLRQHGPLIESVSPVVDVDMQGLPLQEVCEFVAECRSVSLEVYSAAGAAIRLNSLVSLRESLVRLDLRMIGQHISPTLDGWNNISSFTRGLTGLDMGNCKLSYEDPWSPLAALSSLRDLTLLMVAAHGDGASLSDLTGLTHLQVLGHMEAGPVDEALGPGAPLAGGVAAAAPPLFSLSSLQPLSTLQELEELRLYGYALTATSLVGLAGLSSLKDLRLSHCKELVSLEGISTALTRLSISFAPVLDGLRGLSSLVQLQHLELKCCGLTSLKQLATGLSSLRWLEIGEDDGEAGLYGNDGYEVVPDAKLVSLVGAKRLSSCLEVLVLDHLMDLESIAGVERLHALNDLQLFHCWVSSLQPLAKLRAEGFKSLALYGCSNLQEEVIELPHIPATINMAVDDSDQGNIREVVFAGGIRRTLYPQY